MTNENFADQKTDNIPQFAIATQFLKDLSFECPNSNLGIREDELNMDVAVGLSTIALADDMYEITLKLDAKAVKEDKTIFIADVNYSGRFLIKNIPDDQKEMLIGVEAPSLLYPFARRILMNTVIDAGFRTPYIDPINFAHLFIQAKQKNQPAPEQPNAIEDSSN